MMLVAQIAIRVPRVATKPSKGPAVAGTMASTVIPPTMIAPSRSCGEAFPSWRFGINRISSMIARYPTLASATDSIKATSASRSFVIDAVLQYLPLDCAYFSSD